MTATPAILVWTDGSARPTNPGFGGWAYVIDSQPISKVSTGFSWMPYGTTNNRAELVAIEQAVRELRYSVLPRVQEQLNISEEDQPPILINSDSQWAVRTILGDYKAKHHVELIAEIRDLINQISNIKLQWVRGHAGNAYNELADRMATLATYSRRYLNIREDFEREDFLETANRFMDDYEQLRRLT